MARNPFDFSQSPPFFRTFRRHCLRSQRRSVALSLLFSVLSIALSLGSSYTLKILVDDVLVGHRVEWLWPIQGIFILAVVLGNGARLLETQFALRAATRVTGEIRKSMFDRLLVGQLSRLERINSGDFTSSLLYDAGAIQDFVSSSAIAVYSAGLSIVFSLALMLYLSPILTALTLLIIPVLFFVFSTLDHKIAKWNRSLIQERKKLNSIVYQVLGGLIPVRATQTEPLQREAFALRAQAHLHASRRLGLLYVFYGMATWMLIMVPYQALMYGVGGSIYFKTGAPTIGLMLTFANYANGLLGPLQVVANYRKSLASVSESYDSLTQTLQIPDEPSGTQALPDCAGPSGLELHWEGLRFSYGEEGEEAQKNRVLSYPDTKIPANSIVLLKGASGSGKSTLIRILFGLYAYEQGRILVEDVELRSLDLRAYRNVLSYIPQEPVLMQGTVRENLLSVASEATDGELTQLLERLKLQSGQGCLANGLDTEVGELGQAISVGQRQRLVIAQGLLRHSRLYIFDEPNSALDAESSRELEGIIRGLKQEATILLASHDPVFQNLAEVVVELGS